MSVYKQHYKVNIDRIRNSFVFLTKDKIKKIGFEDLADQSSPYEYNIQASTNDNDIKMSESNSSIKNNQKAFLFDHIQKILAHNKITIFFFTAMQNFGTQQNFL